MEESESSAALTKVDPVLRQSIQYILSPKEYTFLYQRALKKLPKGAWSKLPLPSAYANAINAKHDFNTATIRKSIRVFVVLQSGLKLYQAVVSKWLTRKQPEK
jgi:hypothetical protein